MLANVKRLFFAKLSWVFLAFIILIFSFWGAVASNPGQKYLRQKINSVLIQDYGLALDYDSLAMWPGSAGWVVALRNVRFAYDPLNKSPMHSSDPIRRLKITVNPFRLQSGLKAIPRVEVEGLRFKVELGTDRITVDGLTKVLTVDDLSELYARYRSKPKDPNQMWPRILMQDATVVVGFASNQEALIKPLGESVLQTAEFHVEGSIDQKLNIEELDIKSPGFDAISLLHASLGLLNQVKGEGLPLSQSKWSDLFAKGDLSSLHLSCRASESCRAEAQIIGLVTLQQNWIPGVKDMTAQLAWADRKLSVSEVTGTTTLSWDRLTARPLLIGTDHLNLLFTFADDDLRIDIPETPLTYNGLRALTKADLLVPFDDPKKTILNFDAKADDSDWIQILKVLPDSVIGPKTMDWLTQNIHRARASSIVGKGRGIVTEYAVTGSDAGYFTVEGDLQDLTLSYLKKWPELNDCIGRFNMRNLTIQIDAITCKSMSLDVSEGKVSFPDLVAKPPLIQIGFTAQGSYDKSLNFLHASPLASIAKILDSLGVKASTQSTSIAIVAALSKIKNGKKLSLDGKTKVSAGTLNAPLGIYSGTTEKVEAAFDQDGLSHLSGTLFSQKEASRLVIKRDLKADALRIAIDPVVPSATSLSGSAFATPAKAPLLIKAQASGIKLKNTAAVAKVDAMDWQLGEPSLLAIRGSAAVKDFGETSQNFGLPPIFSRGEGDVVFDLKISQLGKQSIQSALGGTLDIELKDGRLEKMPQWMATTINAANLKSFGFKSEQMPYKTLQGKLEFQNGNLKVSEGAMDLGILELRGEGSTDLIAKKMDLNIQFTPDLGALPPAVAVGLWNPIVGLALFGFSQLEEKASDSPLNRLLSQTYKLEGPVDDLKVSLVRPFGFKELIK